MKLIKAFKLMIYIASFISLILSYIKPNFFFIMFGALAVTLINVAAHELGHVLACLITKTKVNYVEVMCFRFQNGGLSISNCFSLYGRVNFVTSKFRKAIYLSGLVVSSIISIVALFLYIYNLYPFIYLMISVICLLVVIIPIKGSDTIKLFSKEE